MTKATMKARKMAKAKGDRQIGGKIGRVPPAAPDGRGGGSPKKR
jgi:hypothetical protein